MEALPQTTRLIEAGIDQGLHPGAQVCVWQGDRCVADAALGQASASQAMRPDHLTLWLSSCKPITALAIARQMEADVLELSDPVAEFVPGFEANGKQDVTIQDVLTHTGGFRSVVFRYPEQTWGEAITAVCNARLERGWEVGQTAGYHPHSGWNILGKVLEVCSGQPLGEHLRDAVLEPWAMTRSFVEMTDAEFIANAPRLAQATDTSGKLAKAMNVHTQPWVTGQRPGGNAWGPASDLARLYRGLLNGGKLDGVRLVQPETVQHFTARHRRDTMDRTFRAVMDWGLGFMPNNARHDAENAQTHPVATPYGFGPHASEQAFGHGGNQSSAAFADPLHSLAVVVVFNGMPGEPEHQRRMHDVLAAIYEDLGLTREASDTPSQTSRHTSA